MVVYNDIEEREGGFNKRVDAADKAKEAFERVELKQVSEVMKSFHFDAQVMDVTLENGTKVWSDGKKMLLKNDEDTLVALRDENGKFAIYQVDVMDNYSIGYGNLLSEGDRPDAYVLNKLDNISEAHIELGAKYDTKYDNAAKDFRDAMDTARGNALDAVSKSEKLNKVVQKTIRERQSNRDS